MALLGAQLEMGTRPAAASTVVPQISSSLSVTGLSVSARVSISGTQGIPGTLWWNIHGPASTGPDGSCDSASYSTSSTPNATLSIAGDGSYLLPAHLVRVPGCYSYSLSLVGGYSTLVHLDPWTGGPKVAVGLSPQLALKVHVASGEATGTAIILGSAGTHNVLSWSLRGPSPRPADGACSDADFSTAAIMASGQVQTIGDSKVALPAEALGGPPACFSYGATLQGPLLATGSQVPLGRPDAVLSTFKGSLGSVFVSPESIVSWTAGRLSDPSSASYQLSLMRSVHIGRVILQNAAGVIDGSGTPDQISTAYPAPLSLAAAPPDSVASYGRAVVTRSTAYSANLSKTFKAPDEVQTMLAAGDVTGMRVALGLMDGRGLYALPTSLTQTDCVISPSCPPTAWMSRMLAYSEQTALEMAPKTLGHRSFSGWYLPMEFSSAGWTSAAAQSDLQYLYGTLSRFLAELTPGAQITIAPFVTLAAGSEALPATPSCPSDNRLAAGITSIPAYDTPCGLMGQLADLLRSSAISELLLQDGMGDQAFAPYHAMAPGELPLWVAAVDEAAQAASIDRGIQIEASMVADLYPRPGSSPDMAAVLQDLSTYQNAMARQSGFSWISLNPRNPANASSWATYRSWVSSL